MNIQHMRELSDNLSSLSYAVNAHTRGDQTLTISKTPHEKTQFGGVLNHTERITISTSLSVLSVLCSGLVISFDGLVNYV